MFGLVAQVSLYDYSNSKNPYVFRFDEREQYGDKSNNARIVFHTHQKSIKESWKTARVQLYNLNDEIWDYIASKGGNWQEGNLESNLFLRLDVGWSNFGENSSLYTIYDGNVNSFWVEREKMDNVFNFSCGMLPSMDSTSAIKIISSTPQSNTINQYSTTRGETIKQLFADLLYNTNYAFTKLGLKPSKQGYAQWLDLIKTRKVQIKINFPIYSNLGEDTQVQDPEGKAWLNEQLKKPYAKTFNPTADLNTFLSSEGAQMVDYYSVISEDSTPVFVIRLRRANIRKRASGIRVPNSNVIINHEMLVKDPVITTTGVQLESLMRPWIGVEDFIKLEIIETNKDLQENQVKNPDYIRKGRRYAVNLSDSSDQYVMTAWGQDTAVLDAVSKMQDPRRKSSIYNEALQVVEIQHLGDTHGNNWHSLIQTMHPGITMG